nr:putative ribonuclease H-like domain-containing protein [Tanacetum cinerariifolium]
MQKVWVLVDLPKGKRDIGSKWVFRIKKDERGMVIKNKARLVAQGHTQEEGIDYEEVFAPVARIKAIRLFLAYASFMGFMVYQIDVKSAFLYGTIEKEVYVCQPPGFEDPDYPDKYQLDEKDEIGVTAGYLLLLLSGILLLMSQVSVVEGFPVYNLMIVDFLNAQVIHYALMVNPTIYVSCIKQFWVTTSIKKVNDVVKLQALMTGRRWSIVRNVDSPSKFLMYPQFLQVLINNQVDDLFSHTTKYTSLTLTQKVFANMRRIGRGFSGIETPLFAKMLVQPQPAAEEEDEKDEVTAAPTPPSPIHAPSPP